MTKSPLKRLILPLWLLIFLGSLSGCCTLLDTLGSPFACHGKGQSHLNLKADPINMGSIPDAMQWDKSAVFAVADSGGKDFTEWLRQVPAGFDSIKSGVWTLDLEVAPRLFMLFGWSPSGADELRRVRVDSAVVKGNQVGIYVSRPHVLSDAPLMGTADMRFVGWEIPLDGLDSGKYTADLFIRRDTITIHTKPFYEELNVGEGYEKAAELRFTIPSAQ